MGKWAPEATTNVTAPSPPRQCITESDRREVECVPGGTGSTDSPVRSCLVASWWDVRATDVFVFIFNVRGVFVIVCPHDNIARELNRKNGKEAVQIALSVKRGYKEKKGMDNK